VRLALLAGALAAFGGSAAAQDHTHHGPGHAAASAPAAAPAPAHGGMGADMSSHHGRTFWMVRSDQEAALGGDERLFAFEADAWIGGDRRKLWLKSDVEVHDGETETAELQALYSRNVTPSSTSRSAVRHDFEPGGRDVSGAGVKGLAPYLFETDAHAFLSENGDVSFRLEQGFEFLLTQRLILEPEAEINLQVSDVPELELASGFTDLEASLQLRYEITRKFAPYVELNYERLLGGTADLARDFGDDPEATTLRAGLRVWF
jgi:copper resistance protein B